MPAEEETYSLFLPGRNGMYLIAQPVTIRTETINETLEILLSELLGFTGNSQLCSLGGNTVLTLYGDDPIELSGGICTVNLAPSAFQLDNDDFYTASLAITATLCELDAVNSVNILVANQSVGMDITGSLPMGTLTARPGENLSVLWEQMEAKRTPVGSDMSGTPLVTAATLYFPLNDGNGIACEKRTITFEGQTPQQMAAGLITALSDGCMYLTEAPDMPDLRTLMLHEPLTSELDDGGRLITVSFRENVEEELRNMHIDPACLIASVACTLSTFIPGAPAVCVRIGETPITTLNGEKLAVDTVLGGLLERDDLKPFLMERINVYYEQDGMLAPCEKTVNRRLTDSPREHLTALLDGPGSAASEQGMHATLPDTLTEEDILGVTREGDTLLVNLSDRFRTEIRTFGKEHEMLLCYSMVNTLCENNGTRRVCFFFEGTQVETIAGAVYWAGEFCRNPGLEEQSYG